MANLSKLMTLVLTFIVIAITVAMASMIVSDIQDTTTTNTYLYNTSDAGLSAFSTFADFLSPLGIIVIAVVIVGALMMFKTYS